METKRGSAGPLEQGGKGAGGIPLDFVRNIEANSIFQKALNY